MAAGACPLVPFRVGVSVGALVLRRTWRSDVPPTATTGTTNNVTRVINTNTPTPTQQAQYMHLALALHQSALPWLRQRGAVDDAGRPPLAAIEAEVGEDDLTGGGLAPAAQRRLRLAVSRHALRVLLQLLR